MKGTIYLLKNIFTGSLLFTFFLLIATPVFAQVKQATKIVTPTIETTVNIPPPHTNIVCSTVDTGNLSGLVSDSEKTNDTIKSLNDLTTSLSNMPVPTQATEIPQALIDTMNARKKALIEGMYRNPTAAMALILSKDKRQTLSTGTENCVENLTTIEGTLQVSIAENFNNYFSKELYYLKTVGGQTLRLHFANKPHQAMKPNAFLSITGYRLDNEVLVDTSKDSSKAPYDGQENSGYYTKESRAQEPVLGTQKVLALLVNFQDTPQPNMTVEQVQDALNQANDYYLEDSYGKIDLSAVVDAGQKADVRGWFDIQLNSVCYMDPGQSSSQFMNAVLAAADSSVDFTQYSRVIILAPFPHNTECDFGGVSTLGKVLLPTPDGDIDTSVFYYKTTIPFENFPQTTIHELGHGFGNHHASFRDCGLDPINSESCNKEEYGDLYDTMGGGKGHYNAIHKEVVGWLDASEIQTVTSSGTYGIGPIEEITLGVKVLKVPRGQNEYLYVEYRQPIGYDADFGINPNYIGNVFEGALLHISDSDSTYSFLIDPSSPSQQPTSALQINEVFTDPTTGTIMTVTNVTPEELTIDVQLGKREFEPPSVTVTSPLVDGEKVSGTIAITADASDESGIKKVELYVENSDDPLAVDNASPYEMNLDTTTLPEGPAKIWVKAYDLAGEPYSVPNNSAESPKITLIVNNTDFTSPTIIFLAPSTENPNYNPFVVFAEVSDSSGVSKVDLLDSTDNILKTVLYPGPYQESFSWPPGNYTIKARAYDVVGNISTSEVSFQIVDGSPSLVMENLASGASVRDGVNIDISLNGVPDVFIVSFNYRQPCPGNNHKVCSMPIFTDMTFPYSGTIQGSRNGNFVVHALSTTYSAENYQSNEIGITIDNSPPEVRILSPISGQVLNGTVDIKTRAVDSLSVIDKVEYYMAGQSTPFALGQQIPGTITYKTSLDTTLLPDGPVEIFTRAYDKAGTAFGMNGNSQNSTPITVVIKNNPFCGDADGSGSVDVSDVVFMINYIFNDGPAPQPLAAADADGNGSIDVSDVVYLINYIFNNGPAPACPGGGQKVIAPENPTNGYTLEQFKKQYPQAFEPLPLPQPKLNKTPSVTTSATEL